MGDELRGESLVHLNVRFSTETELKAIQDMLYEKSGQGVSFTGLVEAMAHEVTIVTAIHNIKSNKGSKTAGVDKMKMDKYLQMPKDELILLIQSCFRKYQPKPARREYIPKSNGKLRPLGIPTVLDRIIQECVRLIIEPICEARFYPHSYGFRPYRAQKHAIRDIVNVINAGCKSPDQAVWAVEGDIQGCFDNISHRILLQKVWRMGIHDKRVLKIISQMLKAGYIERDLYHKTETGTPQGGILSPLLSNIYLNDFDWYVGRTFMEPHRKCKHKRNDTRRLKWAGTTPKYNFRYADDWVVLTSTEKEAFRMKRELTKYFRQKLKLELSQEKTYVTDLRKGGIHFLGYIVKAERKRKTPDPATWTEHLVGKPLPDMERLSKKIGNLLEQVHRIELFSKPNTQAAQIQYVNSITSSGTTDNIYATRTQAWYKEGRTAYAVYEQESRVNAIGFDRQAYYYDGRANEVLCPMNSEGSLCLIGFADTKGQLNNIASLRFNEDATEAFTITGKSFNTQQGINLQYTVICDPAYSANFVGTETENKSINLKDIIISIEEEEGQKILTDNAAFVEAIGDFFTCTTYGHTPAALDDRSLEDFPVNTDLPKITNVPNDIKLIPSWDIVPQ